MKIKTLGVGFILLALIGCASVHRDDPIEIFQKTQSFNNRSFDVVWSATIKSIDEMGFVVRKATKNIGLIHGEARMNPDLQFLPPLINVIIKAENNRIEVNLHIELPGQRDETGRRRTYANRFFKALRKNLR